MKNRNFRSSVSTSLVVGSKLLLGLSAIACSSSSSPGGEAGATSNAAAGDQNAGGSSSTGVAGGTGDVASNGNTGGCATGTLTAPAEVPAIVQTPSGSTLIHHFHAAGTQNYKCTAPDADAGTTYAWVFVAPEAVLSDACGSPVGTHYAGPGGAATPRWQLSADGSFVQGMKVQSSPVAGSIPELLLARTDSSPSGEFANVTYVQRLATVGGAAPDAADCTSANVDELRKSGYSAEYYFYTGGTSGSTY